VPPLTGFVQAGTMRAISVGAGRVMTHETDEPPVATELRGQAAALLAQARGSPMWGRLTQGRELEALARGAEALGEGAWDRAVAALAPAADDPLLGALARALAGAAHQQAERYPEAAAEWERAAERGWPVGHRGAVLAWVSAATAAGEGTPERTAALRRAARHVDALVAALGDDTLVRTLRSMVVSNLAFEPGMPFEEAEALLQQALGDARAVAAAMPNLPVEAMNVVAGFANLAGLAEAHGRPARAWREAALQALSQVFARWPALAAPRALQAQLLRAEAADPARGTDERAALLEQAVSACRAGLAALPDTPSLLEQEARALYDLAQLLEAPVPRVAAAERALRAWDAIAARVGEHPDVLRTLGDLRWKAGLVEEAVTCWERALAVAPPDWPAAESVRGQLAGEGWLGTGAAVPPWVAGVRAAFGLYQRGRHAEAARGYARALDAEDRPADARLHECWGGAHYLAACSLGLCAAGTPGPGGARPATEAARRALLEQAFAHLESARVCPWVTREWVRDDADLAALRSDPRWEPFLASLPAAAR
jgi:tetratricopeptide (TPR) repeat protein